VSLVDRVKARLDPRQKLHERALRQMAGRLAQQISLPPSCRVFTVSRDNQYWFPERLSWKVSPDGRVQVFLRLERDEETRLAYGSLMQHLSIPGFSSVAPAIAQWKKRTSDYLAACYTFASQVTEEVEAVLGTEVTVEYAGQPAVFVAFPLTICCDALDRARGTATSLGFRYATERLATKLIQLRFGAHPIAIATSAARLDRFQREHYDLRNKHATSRRAATVAAAAKQALDLETQIRDRLRRFSLSTPLPGHCHMCRLPTA